VTARHSAARAKLRAILKGDRCVAMASVYDPISARIAQKLGCEVGLMGGSLASLAVLGAPDIILITLTEFTEQVRRATRAFDLPLVVDGDHGYGNALNAIRTIQELDAAGAAAISVEDTLLPRAHGSSEAPQLVPVEEGASRIRAAVAARGEGGPLIFGRTSAQVFSNVDDAIARLTVYQTLGVDALMLSGVRSREDLDRISAATHLPLIVGGMPQSMYEPTYLASKRARLWSSGHQSVNVGIGALHDAMKAVHEGMLAADLPGIATKQTMATVTAEHDYAAQLRAFLAPEQL